MYTLISLANVFTQETQTSIKVENITIKLKFRPSDAKSWLIGKDPGAGKDWGQEGEGDDRGWDGWMALPTQWTWVWASSGRWWRTGKTGVRHCRLGHDFVIEQQQHCHPGKLPHAPLMPCPPLPYPPRDNHSSAFVPAVFWFCLL